MSGSGSSGYSSNCVPGTVDYTNNRTLDDFLHLVYSYMTMTVSADFHPTRAQSKCILATDKVVGCRLLSEPSASVSASRFPRTILSFVRAPVRDKATNQIVPGVVEFQIEECVHFKRVIKKEVLSTNLTDPTVPAVTYLDEFRQLEKKSLGFTYNCNNASSVRCTISWLLDQLTDKMRAPFVDDFPVHPSLPRTAPSPTHELVIAEDGDEEQEEQTPPNSTDSDPTTASTATGREQERDPINEWEQQLTKHPTPWTSIRIFIKSECNAKTPGDHTLSPEKTLRPFLRSFQPHPEHLTVEMTGDLSFDDRKSTSAYPRNSIIPLIEMWAWALLSLSVKWRKIDGVEMDEHLATIARQYIAMVPDTIKVCQLYCRQPCKRNRSKVPAAAAVVTDTVAVSDHANEEDDETNETQVARSATAVKKRIATAMAKRIKPQKIAIFAQPPKKKRQRRQQLRKDAEEDTAESDETTEDEEEEEQRPAKQQRTLRRKDTGASRNFLRDSDTDGSGTDTPSESEGEKRRKSVKKRNRERKTRAIKPLAPKRTGYYMDPYDGSTRSYD